VETEVANASKQHLGRQARTPPFVKLAEDRQHTPDVSEAVEGNGGVTFYRALLLVLAALKCAVWEISITMVVEGRSGDDLTVVELETCDVLAAPKTKPREGGSCKFEVGDGGNRLVRRTMARRRKKEAMSVPRSAALFTLIFILGHV